MLDFPETLGFTWNYISISRERESFQTCNSLESVPVELFPVPNYTSVLPARVRRPWVRIKINQCRFQRNHHPTAFKIDLLSFANSQELKESSWIVRCRYLLFTLCAPLRLTILYIWVHLHLNAYWVVALIRDGWAQFLITVKEPPFQKATLDPSD